MEIGSCTNIINFILLLQFDKERNSELTGAKKKYSKSSISNNSFLHNNIYVNRYIKYFIMVYIQFMDKHIAN